MKKLLIDGTTRKISKDKIVVGYLQENKVEKLEFEIPEEYKTYGRKACFKAQDKNFAKIFDDITGNTLTLTRDMTQYDELEMSIAFFKTENEDEIVARTSILKIYIENAIICDDDIQPEDPKVVILDELIQKVTKLNDQITKDEETRQNQEATRQQNETTREENEQGRVFDELGRKKAEEERKTNELERISNENTREEYINNLKAQVDNGEFDGADFNYKWDGTKLGVKNSKETTYQFVELKGDKGDKGDTGNGIQNIEKVSTVENVDTYAINYTDGTQTTFDVTNGEVTKEQLDEVDNRAKKTRNELERVKNDILETGTASDSFINIQDSAWAELQELSVDGVCEQTTTTGKNLFKPLNNTNNGIITTYDKNGVGTIKGTSANIWVNISADVIYSYPAGNYVFSIDEPKTFIVSIKGTYTDGKIFEFTIHVGSKTKKVAFEKEIHNMYAYISGFTVGTTFNDTIKIQLEKGPTATDFEPYTGGEPSPSPNYPQEIETITGNFSLTSCNKNIFDFEKLKKDNSLSEISGNFVDFTIKTKGATCLLKFPILIDNLYINFKISSNKMNGSIKVVYEDDTLDAIYEKYDNSVISDVNVSKLFNKNKKIKGIRILTFGEITYLQIKEMLLAISSKKELFVEHLESIVNINLPEGEFIGKLDETHKDELVAVYNQEEGQYHLMLNKMIGKIVINGSETISKSGATTNEILVAVLNTNGLRDGYGISNYFIYSPQVEKNKFSIYNTGKNIRFCLDINQYQTIDEFKTWLSTHNIEVYYVLEVPYQVDLGVIDIPLSYNEVTNIFTDSDLLPQINAKYYRNFTKTVQNLQVNEKALKQELIDINNRLTALETAKASESEVNNDIPVE